MLIVFGTHHLGRRQLTEAPWFSIGNRDLLGLLHVALRFTLHGLQVIGEPCGQSSRSAWTIPSHQRAGRTSSGKLLAVALMVTRQQMVDQFARAIICPASRAGRRQPGRLATELARHGLGVQAQQGPPLRA